MNRVLYTEDINQEENEMSFKSIKMGVVGVLGAAVVGAVAPASAATGNGELNPAPVEITAKADGIQVADWRRYRHRHYGGRVHGGRVYGGPRHRTRPVYGYGHRYGSWRRRVAGLQYRIRTLRHSIRFRAARWPYLRPWERRQLRQDRYRLRSMRHRLRALYYNPPRRWRRRY